MDFIGSLFELKIHHKLINLMNEFVGLLIVYCINWFLLFDVSNSTQKKKMKTKMMDKLEVGLRRIQG